MVLCLVLVLVSGIVFYMKHFQQISPPKRSLGPSILAHTDPVVYPWNWELPISSMQKIHVVAVKFLSKPSRLLTISWDFPIDWGWSDDQNPESFLWNPHLPTSFFLTCIIWSLRRLRLVRLNVNIPSAWLQQLRCCLFLAKKTKRCCVRAWFDTISCLVRNEVQYYSTHKAVSW